MRKTVVGFNRRLWWKRSIEHTLAGGSKMGLQRNPSCSLVLIAFPQQVPGIEARPVLDATVDLCTPPVNTTNHCNWAMLGTCLVPADSGRGVLQGLTDGGVKNKLGCERSHFRVVLDCEEEEQDLSPGHLAGVHT